MNNIRRLSVGIILFISVIDLAAAQPAPPLNFTESNTQNPWIKHGKLLALGGWLKSSRFELYVYETSSGDRILLDNNICGVNELLKDEISERGAAKRFLHEEFSQIFFSIMAAHDSLPITPEVTGPTGPFNFGSKDQYGTPSIPPITDEEAAKLNKKIKTYVSSFKPIVHENKNSWKLDFNVMETRGNIEHWVVLGSIWPFQIASFTREAKEPDGTFLPFVTMW